MSGPTEQIKHHAEEARKWAEAADREGTGAPGSSLAEPSNYARAQTYAGVSTAHGLAAIATALGEGFLSVETELVKFGATPADDDKPPIPVKPAPRVPLVNELNPNDRVLCMEAAGHHWPEVLAGNSPVFARVLEQQPYGNLYHLRVEVEDGIGPTIHLHRVQLRIP